MPCGLAQLPMILNDVLSLSIYFCQYSYSLRIRRLTMQNRRIVLFLPFSGHAYNVYYSICSYMTDIQCSYAVLKKQSTNIDLHVAVVN